LISHSSIHGYAIAVLIVSAVVAGFFQQGVAITGLILLALLVSLTASRWVGHWPRPVGFLPWLMKIWLIWLAIAIWWSNLPFVSWFYFWAFAGLPILFMVWQQLPDPEAVWRHLRLALPLGASILALWGLIQAMIWHGNPSPSGPLIDPNAYASTLNLFWFPLCVSWWLQDVPDNRRAWLSYWVYLGALALVTTAQFAAASRGATLVWFGSLPLLGWFLAGSPGARGKAVILVAMALLSYVVARYMTANYDFNEALGGLFVGGDTSVSARLYIWQSTLDMIRDYPWLGTGLGTWGSYYPAYRDTRDLSSAGYFAHSDFLQLAQEGGVVTLAIFAGLTGSMVFLTWKLLVARPTDHRRLEAAGLMLAILAVTLHAGINFIYYYAFMNILVGLFAGRVWWLMYGSGIHWMDAPPKLGRSVILIFWMIVVVAAGQLILHGVSQLLNCDHPVTTALRRIQPKITEYNIARVVHAIRPDEPVALNVVLGTLRLSADEAGLWGPVVQREVLREVAAKYDWARKRWPTEPRYAAEQATMLLKYRELVGADDAIHEAEKIALEALKANPLHAESVIALAESQILLGRRQESLSVLRQAASYAFRMRDVRLMEVAFVRLLTYPTSNDEINEMEEKLRKILPTDDAGRRVTENRAYYDYVQKRLSEIMHSLKEKDPQLFEVSAN